MLNVVLPAIYMWKPKKMNNDVTFNINVKAISSEETFFLKVAH